MNETIRVAFRIDRSGTSREVTAVLPDVPANPGHWTCYAHVGQHGECSIDWYRATRLAKPAEYKALLSELRSIYEREPDAVKLRIVKRIARAES